MPSAEATQSSWQGGDNMKTISSPLPHPLELAPHDPPMLLIDEVITADDAHVVTRTKIASDHIFSVPGRGVPGYVGFELMAQSISIMDGALRRASGEPPAIGFLLGCRKYRTRVEWIAHGDYLEIEAINLLPEGELRSFDCHVRYVSGENIAHGVINVYRPENLETFLTSADA